MPLLQIDIEARYAKFQDALTSMERQTKKSAANMQSAFGGVKATLAGLGVGLGVGALVGIVRSSIDAADHLNDLSKKTGVAVSTLGGLGFAASQAGGDLDSMADAAGKLNRSVADAAGGDKKISDTFKALGIEIREATGELKTADKLIPDIADKFASFADGPAKAAIAITLFKKAGADLIPLLNEGGQALRDNIAYYEKYAGITAETAAKADEFNDKLAKVGLIAGAAGRTITAELLGPLNAVVDAMLDAKEKSGAFETIGKGLATVFEALVILGANVAFTFRSLGDEIGGTAAQVTALANLDFSGFSRIGEEMEATAKRRRQELDDFEARILNPGAPPKAGPVGDTIWTPGKAKASAPIVASGATDNPAARILEGQLRALERASQDERELLASRSDFLQAYYQDDLLAVSQYYDGLAAAQAEALKNQKANIEKEIALVQASKPADARGAAEKANRIQELQDRRAGLQQKAGENAIRLQLEQDRAAKAFKDTLASINAELLEQQGLLPEAAASRFDQANEQITKRIKAERAAAEGNGNAAGAKALDADLARLDALRNMTIAQARLNSLGEIGSRVQADLSAATERAQISAKDGSITELQSLRIVSDARLQAVADLQAVANAFGDVAAQSGNPRMLEQAKAMQVEIDKLAASADLVRDKFEDAFAGSFENAIDRLASGTATLKDVFKGLLADITSEITRFATQDFAKQLFAKNGALGGVVDSVSGFFGGTPRSATAGADVAATIGGATDAAATTAASTALTTLAATTSTVDATMITLAATVPVVDAGLFAMATTTIAADGALITLTGAAGVAAAALAAVAGQQAGQAAGSIAALVAAEKGRIFVGGNVTPFAKGGIPGIIDTPTFFPMRSGGVGLMGEAGPEAIMPLKAGKGGQLSVTMLDAAGRATLLPVTRDGDGRLAVRAQAFADGGTFSRGSLMRDSGRVFGVGAGMSSPVAAAGGGDTHVNVQVAPPAGSSTASAQQWGAAAGRQIQKSLRRNN